MLPYAWQWWLTTDAGLAARIILGVTFFATLAILDLHRHGKIRLIALTLVTAALTPTILGFVGHAGGLTWCSPDFVDLVRHDLFRPHRFLTVFGIHLGGYVGGLAGTLLAVSLILQRRASQPDRPKDTSNLSILG